MTAVPFKPPLPHKKKGEKRVWKNIQACAQPFAIAHAACETSGPIMVLAPDTQHADKLIRELTFFLPSTMPVLHFPDWEILPYDNFSPHQDIISDRLRVLSQLPFLEKGLLVVPVSTLLHRLAPTNYINAYRFSLEIGTHFDWEKVGSQLAQSGYRAVSQVMTPGEFATRGSIIDIFPMGLDKPVRIDLFSNNIDSLRFFDPNTQRSTEKIEKLTCLPAHEFPLTPEAISLFRQKWRATFEGDPLLCPIYQSISQGLPAQGIEYYLPLFFDETSTLFDYLPHDTTLIFFHEIEKALNAFWHEINLRYEQYRHDVQRPILPPSLLFLPVNTFFLTIKSFQQVCIHSQPGKEGTHFTTRPFPDLTIDARSEKPLEKLSVFLNENRGKVLFCAESPGRREIVLNLLNQISLSPTLITEWRDFFQENNPVRFGITLASLEEGLWLPDQGQIWIAENQLYSHQVMQRRRRKKAQDQDPIRDLSELTLHAPIVHMDHGVGRYLGLTHLTIDGLTAEYLLIEYADNDKLYVPVSSLHLISQYSGTHITHAPLHKLGTDQWEKAKRKAAEKIHDVAAELLETHAKRAASKGHCFSPPTHLYFEFAHRFPFEETPDQAKAIEAVLEDMQSNQPMDRLICGDVGFGKTEVALRAAFLAVQDSKQVAVLVPTTLLAQQHFETFHDRFAYWPVRIDVLSRFRSKKEQEKILSELAQGKIDIIIGTHKLLQENIAFKSLGLMIIDEEHRFGVRQKEKLKALRSETDILTLTATPIPRTLNMALASFRSFSIIVTPPAKRLSIKTFVREYHLPQIFEAILREIMRGGQVYYLHNDIDTIEKVAQTLSTGLPQIRVQIAHGQMRERELEQVMSDFYHQRFNVLVCTTIIETGIDIPTANTIIIDRADKLGLAQLHQLRGRVGRSHHQAYAYCLTPPAKQLSTEALKRLEALELLEELGSGFTLATHDLEIRGAGELLGEEQSGNIHEIGFSLYREFLEKAVRSLQSGISFIPTASDQGAEINLQIPALIPKDYLPDVHSRLILYKRIASAKDVNALHELQVEMIDRFGLLPEATKNLFRITLLKLHAKPLGIRKIEAASKAGKIEFHSTPSINPDKVITLIRTHPTQFKLMGSSQLKFTFDMQTVEQRFQVIENLLQTIT